MRRWFGRLRGSIFDLGMALWANGLPRRFKSRKKGLMVNLYLQKTNRDGASAELRRRAFEQRKRQEEELQFDISNA